MRDTVLKKTGGIPQDDILRLSFQPPREHTYVHLHTYEHTTPTSMDVHIPTCVHTQIKFS